MQGRLALSCLAVVLAATVAGAQTAPPTTPQKPATAKKGKAPVKPPAPAAKPEPVKPAAETPPPPVEAPRPAAEASSPVPAVQPPPEPPRRTTRVQRPGDVDARLTLNADVILAFVNAGVGVDVGVLPLGPGTLSIGGEFEFGACVTFCAVLSLATGWQFSNLYYAPHARIAYHFLPGNAPGLEKVDLYGLVFGGVTLTTTRVAGTASGTEFEYVGNDVGPSLGLGVGGKFFPQEKLFLGAEARLRYSAGVYAYTARAGNVSISDSQASWSLSGINVQLFGGLRF